ncbi:MAG: beta-galactosidase trimerization domain-containing protein, partial [Candidatus Hydrogenedentes bacterium]|nr:beta-galactosidase trimerization domain-containing protein [Candidatus Hydrogenedentota bacterium]
FRTLGADGVAGVLANLGFTVHEQAFPALPGYEGSYLRGAWTPEEYRALIDACHRRDIRVTPYLNVHGFYVELCAEHPDWPQRLPPTGEGAPAVRGNGRWAPPCYNSSWRDFALDAITAMARDYAIDGIFLDGPSFYPQTCYCSTCRARFRKATGHDLPAWGDRQDLAWPPFLAFRSETLAAFLADVRRRLDEARPGEHLVLYMNNTSLGATWSSACRTRLLAPYLDILGNERANLFSAPPALTPLWLPGVSMKILETQAKPHGQPTVQYCCFRHLPWDYYPLHEAEYRCHIAGVLANGGHPQVMGGWRYLDPTLQRVVREMSELQSVHPGVFCGSQSAANVALLWPQRTADFGGTQTPMLATTQAQIYPQPPAGAPPPFVSGAAAVQDEFYGWAEVLFRSGIPYDVIDEDQIESGAKALHRYAALILPAAQCLPDAACAAIEEFVRGGGHLVVTGTTSLCNEWDAKRPDFGLADVFGASYAGHLIGPLPIDYIEVRRDSKTCSLPEAQILSGITHDAIPAPPAAVGVIPRTASVLAVHLHKLLTRYEPLTRDENPPAVVLANRCGNGTCAFLAGMFGAAYWQHRFPDHRRLLGNAVLWRCTPPVELLPGGDPSHPPETVEVSWRRAADGRWLLHLVNHTGAMSRPIERTLPVHGLRISLPALAKAGNIHATCLRSGRKVGVEQKRGAPPLVSISRLEDYDVIVFSVKPLRRTGVTRGGKR